MKMRSPKSMHKMPRTNWKGRQQLTQRLANVLARWFKSWRVRWSMRSCRSSRSTWSLKSTLRDQWLVLLWSDSWNISKLRECQFFNISSLRKDETCADISSDAKCFILYFKRKTFGIECFRLRYFTIICNVDERKRMDQDLSRGQLYYDEDDIDLNKDTQPSSGQTNFL